MALRADELLNLIETILGDPHLATLRAHPGLAWLEPRLVARIAELLARLAALEGDPKPEA